MKEPSTVQHHQQGASWVEVIMAVLLLSTAAVAGGAFYFHARALMAMQRERLLALDRLSSRLEQIRASPRAAFSNLVSGGVTNYLTPGTGGVWKVGITEDVHGVQTAAV